MGTVLKVLLWLGCIAIVVYLVFGVSKKDVVAPDPEMTGGAGGERAQTGVNIDFTSELSDN